MKKGYDKWSFECTLVPHSQTFKNGDLVLNKMLLVKKKEVSNLVPKLQNNSANIVFGQSFTQKLFGFTTRLQF